MQKWRYHSLVLRDLAISESKLNSEGEKGWELVSLSLVDANTARAYFKMPLEDFEKIAVVETHDAAVGQAAGPFDLTSSA